MFLFFFTNTWKLFLHAFLHEIVELSRSISGTKYILLKENEFIPHEILGRGGKHRHRLSVEVVLEV